MLPFNRPKSIGAVMIHKMDSSGKQEPMHEEDAQDPGLIMAMEDLMSAVNVKDATKMAEAFKSAFEILESRPHEEAGE